MIDRNVDVYVCNSTQGPQMGESHGQGGEKQQEQNLTKQDFSPTRPICLHQSSQTRSPFRSAAPQSWDAKSILISCGVTYIVEALVFNRQKKQFVR